MSPSSTALGSTGPGLIAQTDIQQVGGTRFTVAGGMDWIIAAAGSAWSSNESVTRLDGRTGAVLSTIPLPGVTCASPRFPVDRGSRRLVPHEFACLRR